MPCSKRMRACHARCLHRQMVLEYRDARDAWEAGRESKHNMQMEDDDYREAYPPITFKDWLIGMRRSVPPPECDTADEQNAFWDAMDDAREEERELRREAEEDMR